MLRLLICFFGCLSLAVGLAIGSAASQQEVKVSHDWSPSLRGIGLQTFYNNKRWSKIFGERKKEIRDLIQLPSFQHDIQKSFSIMFDSAYYKYGDRYTPIIPDEVLSYVVEKTCKNFRYIEKQKACRNIRTEILKRLPPKS